MVNNILVLSLKDLQFHCDCDFSKVYFNVLVKRLLSQVSILNAGTYILFQSLSII